jgi:hypothetical protein
MTFDTMQELADALSEDSVKDMDEEDFEELLHRALGSIRTGSTGRGCQEVQNEHYLSLLNDA